MVTVLEIDGKKLHSIKAATKLVSYSADYITRLAREQKIVASQVGRQWYIDVESLQHYESVMETEQTIRKQRLSEERKQERLLREQAEVRRVERSTKLRAKAARTKVVVSAAVMLGLFSGYILESMFAQLVYPAKQAARTPAASTLSLLTTDVAPAEPTVVTTLATTSDENSGMEVATFTAVPDQVRSFASSSEGILLLPPTLTEGQLVELQDLFSDRIVIRTDASGQKFVSQVNGQSEIIGSEIPVITVPVNVITP